MAIVVVGAGVIGLSATAALVRSGADVTCFEATGSVLGERSAGSSRIFRLAHTAPELVTFASVARDGFAGWSARAGAAMVDGCGCVVSGVDAADRASAMAAAGVPHELHDGPVDLGLPAVTAPSPALVDPGGGVVDVDAVRRFLLAEAGHAVVHERVRSVRVRDGAAVVTTASGEHPADAVLIAAGADTPALAAPSGIALPAALEHHARFTFGLPDDRPGRPAWIDHPARGLATYQHRTGPGRWSVGGTVDPSLVAWDNGRDAATAAAREVVVGYAAEHLSVDPSVLETLYCTHAPATGDGIVFRRAGPVLAVYGENLMKFAPALGDLLSAAVVDGSTPGDLG